MQGRSIYADYADAKSIKVRNTIDRQTSMTGISMIWIEHEECCQIASELDMYDECDYDEGLSSDCFKEILDDYIHQEHYNDFADDIAEDWQSLTRYEEVCKILEELKEKGGER